MVGKRIRCLCLVDRMQVKQLTDTLQYLQDITNKCTIYLIINCVYILLHVSKPQCITINFNSHVALVQQNNSLNAMH
jgi:hypothetical protein